MAIPPVQTAFRCAAGRIPDGPGTAIEMVRNAGSIEAAAMMQDGLGSVMLDDLARAADDASPAPVADATRGAWKGPLRMDTPGIDAVALQPKGSANTGQFVWP